EFARELAESFLDSAPRCLTGIDRAVRDGDAVALTSHAHALNGISRSIGAGQLADACAELEIAGRRADLRAAVPASARVGDSWERVRAALEADLVAEVEK